MNPFKPGDKVRLKLSKENQKRTWYKINISYIDTYEVFKVEDDKIFLKYKLNTFNAENFEFAEKKEERYLLIYCANNILNVHTDISSKLILSYLNKETPEKHNIKLFKWFDNKSPVFIEPNDWPFLIVNFYES